VSRGGTGDGKWSDARKFRTMAGVGRSRIWTVEGGGIRGHSRRKPGLFGRVELRGCIAIPRTTGIGAPGATDFQVVRAGLPSVPRIYFCIFKQSLR
jgi:hypothetical protein